MASGRIRAALVWAALGLGLLAVVSVLRLPALVDAPLDRDEGAYAFIAQQWRRGILPYRDYFDHKPPLVYLAYGVSFAVGGERLAAVRAAFTGANAATAVACAVVVWVLSGRRRPLPVLLAALAAAVCLSSPVVQGETANTEGLMVLGTAWSAALLVLGGGRRLDLLLLAGVSAGLAILAKPVAACEASFLALWVARGGGRPWRGMAAYAGGALLPVIAWCLYAAAQGALLPSLDAVILYNLRYAGIGTVPLWARVVAIPIELGLPLALLWAGAAGCTLTSLRTSPGAANFALGWTVAAVVGTVAAGRIYGHYYQQLVPPLAVALGVTLNAVTARMGGRWVRVACVLVVVAGVWPALSAVVRFAEQAGARACVDWQSPLAAVLGEMTGPGDRILVWGAEPYVYFAAKRRPPGRFIYRYPLLGEGAAAVAARRELLAAWAAERPVAMVAVTHESTAEASPTPADDILSPGSPLHALSNGLVPVLDTADFKVYAIPELTHLPWRERWQASLSALCSASP